MALFTAINAPTAITAAATKTILLLNPVTNQFELTEIAVGFGQASDAQDVRVELYRTVTLGSPAGTTVTLAKKNPASQSPTTTALGILTTEPTSVEVIKQWYVNPHGGQIVIPNPLGNEEMAAAAGSRLGIRYVSVTGVTPIVAAHMEIRE